MTLIGSNYRRIEQSKDTKFLCLFCNFKECFISIGFFKFLLNVFVII